MENLTKYFRDTAFELKQVTWPTQRQALLYTALVIAISIIVALFVGAFDFLFSQGVSFLVNNI
jgi:preprotein translocase subunit SecE